MPGAARTRGRRIATRVAAALAAAALAAGLVYLWAGAKIAAGFSAKTVCSCLFVERRDEGACRADLGIQGFGWVSVAADREGRAVEARALRLRSARAQAGERSGCTLR